jgi:hypothetical protein
VLCALTFALIAAGTMITPTVYVKHGIVQNCGPNGNLTCIQDYNGIDEDATAFGAAYYSTTTNGREVTYTKVLDASDALVATNGLPELRDVNGFNKTVPTSQASWETFVNTSWAQLQAWPQVLFGTYNAL